MRSWIIARLTHFDTMSLTYFHFAKLFSSALHSNIFLAAHCMIINILKIMDQSCDKIGDSTQTYFICLMSEPVDNSVSDYKDFIHWEDFSVEAAGDVSMVKCYFIKINTVPQCKQRAVTPHHPGGFSDASLTSDSDLDVRRRVKLSDGVCRDRVVFVI